MMTWDAPSARMEGAPEPYVDGWFAHHSDPLGDTDANQLVHPLYEEQI